MNVISAKKNSLIKNELYDHLNSEHAYRCETCGYRGKSVNVLQEHILDKHIHMNKDGKFSRDECSVVCSSKQELWDHFCSSRKEDTEETEVENRDELGCTNEVKDLRNERKGSN